MKKIDKKDFKKAAEIFTEIFKDYPLYTAFFNKEKLYKGIYYFFCFEIYEGLNYTYKNDEETVFAIIKKPEDKSQNSNRLFYNPVFFVKFFYSVGMRSAKLGLEYMEFCEKYAKKYKSDKDLYIKNIGVKEEARGQGLFRAALDELCQNESVFLETHSIENVKIYENLGFKLLATENFHGISHYIMRRS